ncbi:MAG: hypothetical protein HQL32_07870, partial [Planctomycetes bacterium]|nr:hypothetical protein [Planctomycetota bacterium]
MEKKIIIFLLAPILCASCFLSFGQGLATGHAHSLILRADGSLWSWGANQSNQAGHLGSNKVSEPTQVGADTDWMDVSSGASHSAALKMNGDLYVWGQNQFGQCGLGHTNSVSSPTLLSIGEPGKKVSLGAYSSYVVGFSGNIYSFGRNNSGELGTGITNAYESTPGGFDFAEPVMEISAGADYCSAITAEGNLWLWGSNGYGQIAKGNGASYDSPQLLGSDNDWVKVSCGDFHVLALKENGDLYAWGKDTHDAVGTTGLSFNATPSLI